MSSRATKGDLPTGKPKGARRTQGGAPARTGAGEGAANQPSLHRRIISCILECGHSWTGTPSGGTAHCPSCAVREAKPTREEQWMKETESLLRASLSFAVPLWVQRYRDEKRSLDDLLEKARHAGELVAEQGDTLMFRTKAEKEANPHRARSAGTAAVFNALAAGVAAASFMPGGVTAFGAHFESDPKWLEAA